MKKNLLISCISATVAFAILLASSPVHALGKKSWMDDDEIPKVYSDLPSSDFTLTLTDQHANADGTVTYTMQLEGPIDAQGKDLYPPLAGYDPEYGAHRIYLGTKADKVSKHPPGTQLPHEGVQCSDTAGSSSSAPSNYEVRCDFSFSATKEEYDNGALFLMRPGFCGDDRCQGDDHMNRASLWYSPKLRLPNTDPRFTQNKPWQIHGAFEKDGYNHIIIIGYVDGIDREDEINAYVLTETTAGNEWKRIGFDNDCENDGGKCETQSYLLNDHDFIAVLKIKGLTESTIIKFTYQYAADTIDYADGEINESPYLFVCGNKFSAGLDACNPFTDDADDITIHAEENGYRITAKLTSTRAAPPKEDVEAGKVRLIDASDGGVVAVDDIWISLGGGGPKLHIVIDDIDDIAGHELYIKYGSAKTPIFTVGEGEEQDPDPDPDPDPNPTYIDDDNDGIDDAIDNCLGVANTDQDNWNDSDDNEGDACDNSDGDSYLDDVDNCPEDDNEDQINSDGDIKGDECDNDDDNDGIPDADDECPLDEIDMCNLSGGGGGTIIEQIVDLIEEVDDGITMLPGGSSRQGGNGNNDGDGNSVVTAGCSLTPTDLPGSGVLITFIMLMITAPILATRVTVFSVPKKHENRNAS